MKKIQWYVLMAALVVLAACESVPPVAESGNTRNTGSTEGGTMALSDEVVLQNRYLAFLREEGYSPSIDSDGDIQFKIQGKSYYVIINGNDVEYFYILYPNFWSANTAQRRQLAARAASYASGRTKVARAYLGTNNYVSATSEVFLNDPEDYRYFFSRMLTSLTTVVDYFEEYIEEH
jgi:hypothetical protein